MAIARGNTAVNTSSAATSLSFTKPTGLANGDVLVSVCGNSGTTAVIPTGFTLIGRRTTAASEEIILAYKVITDATSEPASYTWTGTSGRTSVGGVIYTGVNTSNVLDVTAATAASTSPVSTSLTTVTNGAWVVAACVGDWSTAGISTPWSQIIYLLSPGRATALSDNLQTTAGSTGSITFANGDGAALAMASVSVALRPVTTVTGGLASGSVLWATGGAAVGMSGPPVVLGEGAATGSVTHTGVASGSNDAGPANLVATTISTSRIDLTWSAAAGATGYDIERDGVVIVTDHPTTGYSDTGLAENTTYTYRVRTVR
jgi:hypothetical protein